MPRYFAMPVVILLCLVLGAEEQEDKIPELKVAKLTKPAPKIDGKLDEEAWKEAASADQFKLSFGETPRGKAKFYIAQDKDNLYVAFECFESAEYLKTLKAEITEHDGDIWGEDEVELFIDPTGKRQSYYQILVSARGTTLDAFMPFIRDTDKTWEPKYEVKTSVGADRWIAELAIPFAAFDRTAKSEAEWAFNACHLRAGTGEFLYWSPVFKTDAHTPARFGKLFEIPVREFKAAEKK